MKTKNLQRLISLLVAALLLVGVFSLVACADEEQPSDTPNEGEQTSGGEETPEEEPRIMPDVPDGMYDYTINVMHWSLGGYDFIWEETCPDESITSHTSDLIADDIFDRTAWLEENYGFVITKGYQEHVGMPTAVAKMI